MLLRRERSNRVAFKGRGEVDLIVLWLLLLIQSITHWEFSRDSDKLLINVLIGTTELCAYWGTADSVSSLYWLWRKNLDVALKCICLSRNMVKCFSVVLRRLLHF